MRNSIRTLLPYLVLLLLLAGGLLWAASFSTLPPADFTFCNGTEVSSIDPARVTGQPECNVIIGLFEGLCQRDAKTLEPKPGVAKNWDISDDKLTYTFHLRDDAQWSDGTPVTADDFVWSFRRFLHPGTAAGYSYEMWYVTHAQNFTLDKVAVGDPVEVDLAPTPDDAGETLHGKLLEIEDKTAESEDPAKPDKVYVVEIDGQQRRFKTQGKSGKYNTEPCGWVLPDFDSVAIHALDPHTLKIHLDNPTPYFLTLMGFFPMMPVNRACVQKYGYPEWTKPGKLVGNGPFNLTVRRMRDRIRLEKSATYWDRDNIRLRSIDILAAESAPTVLNLYLTGKADFIPKVPTAIIPTFMDNRRPDFHPVPSFGVYMIRLNCSKKPFDDPRVRRALNMAIDKQSIVDNVTRAGQTPARSLVPESMKNYTDYQRAECEAYNPEAARRLLAEAGFPNGEGFPKLEILYNTDEDHQAVLELVLNQLESQLHIKVGLRNEEWGSYKNDERSGNYLASRGTWIGDYPDPNTFLNMFVTNGDNNHTYWSNPKYDELIASAAKEPDLKRRDQMFHDAERILMDELPLIPIYFYVTTDMWRPYVHGIYENAQDTHPYGEIWIDEKAKAEFLKGGDR